MEMSREDRWWRSIRWAAYGCLVLALLQAVSLPWPFGHTELGELAIPRWIGQLSFSLLFALALFNRQLWAAVLLGLYGVTRLYVIASGIVHIFDGSAFASQMGPARYLPFVFRYPSRCSGSAARGARFSCGVQRDRMPSEPSNVSLQLSSARSCGSVAVSAYRVARARRQASRILSRPLAAELWALAAAHTSRSDQPRGAPLLHTLLFALLAVACVLAFVGLGIALAQFYNPDRSLVDS
jgi:hypothetical protein